MLTEIIIMVLKKDESKVFGMEGKVCLLYILVTRGRAFDERTREWMRTEFCWFILVHFSTCSVVFLLLILAKNVLVFIPCSHRKSTGRLSIKKNIL